MIDRTTIDRIMATADIVDVVKDFVSLRKSGQNYKGLCPFHDERTPSFMVSPSKQLCKCFSCGKGGNVVKFLMEHEQLTYPEAIKWLGRKYGIEVKDREMTAEQRAAATERDSMLVVNEFARDFFMNCLHESVDGMAIGMGYFRRRGLRDDIIRKFQLGYSPEQRQAFCTEALAKGYEEKYLEKTGLCLRQSDGRLIDRYASRVIFPVHSVSGRVVAFGGRTLLSKEEQKRRAIGKYVNSPESEVYSKRRELYGLYQAKQAISRNDCVYLVEGYLDVISMHQSGIENVVASSGTSLTREQVRLIHRFTNHVTLLYDGDAAGIKAAMRGVDILLAEGLHIKVVLLPDGEDPDSYAQTHTPDDFRAYIAANEADFIRFETQLLLADAHGDPLRRAEVVREVVRSIAVIPDNIVRQTYVHEISGLMGIDENIIVNEVRAQRKKNAEEERERQQREAAAAGAGSANALQQQGTASFHTGAPAKSGSNLAPDEPPIFDDEGNIVNGPAITTGVTPTAGGSTGYNDGHLADGTRADDATRHSSKSDILLNGALAAGRSRADRLLEGCERVLAEMVVRYGGLPIVLQPEVVERKFGPGATPSGKTSENAMANIATSKDAPDESTEYMDQTGSEPQNKRQPTLIEDPESPIVASFILAQLEAQGMPLCNPLHQRILEEAAGLADDAFARRRKVIESGVEHRDAPPFFDATSYFCMHADNDIAQCAESLADDRYILSSGQARMYTPDERRLVEMIPRVVNEYIYAHVCKQKEQLLATLRDPALLTDSQALADAMVRLQELNETERDFSLLLGGRVIRK